MPEREDFYKKLKDKIRNWMKSKDGKTNKWVEYLMFAPDLFHLLCKLAIDPGVSVKDKAKLAGAITYFVAPIDIIPEALVGTTGYIDDIALAAYVLSSIINNNPELVRKHWAGDGDVLEVIKSISKVADQMVGSGIWKKIKKVVS